MHDYMYRCHYISIMCRFFVCLPDGRITTGVNNGVVETTILPCCSVTDGSGSFQEQTLFDKHSHHSQVIDPLALYSEIQTDKNHFQQLASRDLRAHRDDEHILAQGKYAVPTAL